MNEYDYLAKAKHKMEKENYHEVISLCDKALKINDNLPEAYDFRANAKFELGKYDDALEDFDELIKREPDDAEHYYDRSWTYCKMNQYEEAIVDINRALEIEPRTSLYYYEKGRFEYWASRYREAIVDLTKGIELRPTENKYIDRANSYMELEEYSLALSDYNFAIEIDTECARAYYHRGILYKILDRLKDAENDFKKVLELCPKNDDAMIELGIVRIASGKKDGLRYFSKAIKTNPSAENYYYRIKARYRILKRNDMIEKVTNCAEVNSELSEDNKIYNDKQAQDDIKDLEKAIALDSENLMLYEMRVRRFIYLGEYQKAIEDYNCLIEVSPNSFYYGMRAFCEERIGQHKEALEDCKKAVELNDGAADLIILGIRGLANYKLRNYKNAITDFNQTLDIENDAETFYFRGQTNYKLKNFRQAYYDFNKAIEIVSDIESQYDEKIPKLIKIFLNKNSQKDIPIGLTHIK